LAVSTSSRLAAEKFSSPFQIVIVLLNLTTHRTNSAAGRACNPSLLTISISLRMQFKVEARAKRVALPIQGEVSFPSRKSVTRPSWLAVISPTFFVKRLS
jgi:hypothetical protein